MSDIKITVRDKIAIAPLGKVVVGSNTSYRIVFSFDDEWTENAKTARFTFGGSYIDVPFTGNTVNMPLIDGVDRAYVGVYAGNMRTTSPALLCMRSSIKSGGVPHSAPTQDVYEQIMNLINDNLGGESSSAYTKPDGGIPASDMASAVQTSLAKADSAVQPEAGKGLFSGSYNDLTNKPTIPAAQVNADWNASSGVAKILNKPTIPTVPTNVSAFNNDSGYLTLATLPIYDGSVI